MNFQIEILWSDALLFLLAGTLVIFFAITFRQKHWQIHYNHLMRNRIGISAMLILVVFFMIALIDSCHFHKLLSKQGNHNNYSPQEYSVLDSLLSPLNEDDEETYSSPFASKLFVKSSSIDANGKQVQYYAALKFAAHGIQNEQQKINDILQRIVKSSVSVIICWLIIISLFLLFGKQYWQVTYYQSIKKLWRGHTIIAWRSLLLTLLLILLFIWNAYSLSRNYHIFGTNTIGVDVFYQAVKSIRTGIIIGVLTTIVMLPFSLILGMMAGYFGGIIDDVIQYVYTVLNSIPSVLLIAAAVLSLQIFITNHPQLFSTIAIRADIRLLALCLILGVTSWTGLCRLLRAETLKVREADYIQAARAQGSSHFTILFKHVLPNIFHIIIISVVIDFSSLVLAEAVLSYVGVGVDPTTISWGNMINSARLQLSREPAVWWPLLAAFVFMFILVLAANLFSDAVRDAFDPKLH